MSDHLKCSICGERIDYKLKKKETKNKFDFICKKCIDKWIEDTEEEEKLK